MNITIKLKPTLTLLILTVICLFSLTCTLYLYARHGQYSSTHNDAAYCADCIHYAMSIDAKIRQAEQGGAASVRTNKQFFRYALDVTCRDGLFVDKRCLDFRRGFLRDVGRYMVAVAEPYEACRGVGACR